MQEKVLAAGWAFVLYGAKSVWYASHDNTTSPVRLE